jgi:hypothetical protein
MEAGYQSDAIEITKNFQEVFTIPDEHMNLNRVFYLDNRNRYAVINGNMVTGYDLRLRRTGGPGNIGTAVLKLPKPITADIGIFAWNAFTNVGDHFYCQMNDHGIVVIGGTTQFATDEVIIKVPPYLAKVPLEFDDIIQF